MIKPVTGSFKIVQYNDKNEDTIENLVDKSWLCRYPMPTIITYNCGNEFLSHTFRNDLIQDKYKIKPKYATIANLQEKCISERIQEVI